MGHSVGADRGDCQAEHSRAGFQPLLTAPPHAYQEALCFALLGQQQGSTQTLPRTSMGLDDHIHSGCEGQLLASPLGLGVAATYRSCQQLLWDVGFAAGRRREMSPAAERTVQKHSSELTEPILPEATADTQTALTGQHCPPELDQERRRLQFHSCGLSMKQAGRRTRGDFITVCSTIASKSRKAFSLLIHLDQSVCRGSGKGRGHTEAGDAASLICMDSLLIFLSGLKLRGNKLGVTAQQGACLKALLELQPIKGGVKQVIRNQLRSRRKMHECKS